MITADNITREQIEKLYNDAWNLFVPACEALGFRTPVLIDMARLPEEKIYAARERCAQILNDRERALALRNR